MYWLLLLIFILFFLVIVAFLFFVKYENRIAKKIGLTFSVSQYLLDPLSKYFPEIFFKRNKKKIWNPSNAPKSLGVYGYVNKHSIFPGQEFKIMLSTSPEIGSISGRIEISRIGYYEKKDRKLKWRSDNLAIQTQEVHDSTASIGLMWKPLNIHVDSQDWESGFYDIDFIANDGKKYPHVAFIVVKNSISEGDMLVKITTNTYQAYNTWGGHNLYRSELLGPGKRGYMVSFDRPMVPFAFHDFYTWEIHFVFWLEELAKRSNFKVHYITSFDAHSDVTFSDKYKLLISVGHDEYWSKEEFENTYRRIFKLGKNTMFWGANTAYWQVRYADLNAGDSNVDLGRQMVLFKSLEDPIKYRMDNSIKNYTTARFRDVNLPETMLMGVAYEYFRGGERQKLYVKENNFPFFKNTNYKSGDLVGRLIGHEWDNIDPEKDNKRLFSDKNSNIPLIPLDSINVLFSGTAIGNDGRIGKSESVYFLSTANAKVFSSGTNGWAKGLIMEGNEGNQFKKLNENMILDFLDLKY